MAWKPGGSLARILLVTTVTCALLGVIPASASALATLSGKVYFFPTGICLPPCEVPVPGVTIDIRTSSNAPVKTATTAADGTWSTTVFGSAGGFDYNVYVEGYQVTPAFQHITPANGLQQVQGFDNMETANVDFRVRGSVITGNVFHDLDNDGVKDAGEPGVGSASVAVTGPASKNVTTNGSGNWSTGSPILPAGSYSATASKANYDTSTPTAHASPGLGTNDAADDFGLHFQTGTVSGVAYAETNGTPGQQAEEPPIGGVTVTVSGTYDGQAFSLPTQSLADGSFSLPVFVGTSRTVTETQPATYADGPDFTAVAGPSTGDDVFTTVSVAKNVVTGPLQFGETGATISGVTFSDRDSEGIRDAGEPAIGGRVIQVTASGFSASVTSAPDGSYVVNGLPAGDVTLTPATTADALAPAARILQPGVAATIADQNFGYRFTGLAGKVIDRSTGQPLAGATVTLSGSAAQTTTTAADGTWSFFDLTPGTYGLTASKTGFDAAASTAGDLGGAGGPGAVTGIGAGLGQQGNGYELGLAPNGAAGQPATPGGQGAGANKLGRKVKIVAAKRVKVRKAKLKLGCTLDAGVVKLCTFVVRDKRKKVLARGVAKALKKRGKTLTATLKLTKLGKARLARSPKGLKAKASVTATQVGGPALKAAKAVKLRLG